MEVKTIPWMKTEEIEFVNGDLLLAIKDGLFSLPIVVRSLGNGKVVNYSGEGMYSTTDFDYYAVITKPSKFD